MQAKSYFLQVNRVTRETEDAVSILFDVPHELRNIFNFQAGQHITLTHPELGESVKRSYSLCSAPYEGTLMIATRRVPNGIFSNYLNDQLKSGDKLQIEAPDGRFCVSTEANTSKEYVFFASGSGITPILSLMKQILYEEKHSQILLFYGNRKSESIMFLEDLMALKNTYSQRISLHFLLSREELEEDLFNGRINADKLEVFAKLLFNPVEVDGFFLCGPETMLMELREKLIHLGVPTQKIHLELFGVQITRPAPKLEGHDGEVSRIRLTLDGRTMEYNLPFGSETLLDSALKNGARLPYACKGGVCCTCKAKLLSGEVEMLRNYGLEPDEIEKGYILSCQSYPKSEKIELSFDQ